MMKMVQAPSFADIIFNPFQHTIFSMKRLWSETWIRASIRMLERSYCCCCYAVYFPICCVISEDEDGRGLRTRGDIKDWRVGCTSIAWATAVVTLSNA